MCKIHILDMRSGTAVITATDGHKLSRIYILQYVTVQTQETGRADHPGIS